MLPKNFGSMKKTLFQSSLIRTIPSATESHRINLKKQARRLLLPVGNCTLPRRPYFHFFFIIRLLHMNVKPFCINCQKNIRGCPAYLFTEHSLSAERAMPTKRQCIASRNIPSIFNKIFERFPAKMVSRYSPCSLENPMRCFKKAVCFSNSFISNEGGNRVASISLFIYPPENAARFSAFPAPSAADPKDRSHDAFVPLPLHCAALAPG